MFRVILTAKLPFTQGRFFHDFSLFSGIFPNFSLRGFSWIFLDFPDIFGHFWTRTILQVGLSFATYCELASRLQA